KLVDQRTFAPSPQTPGEAALSRSLLPADPAARLRPADPAPDWRATLDAVAQQALARDPGAQFEVMAPIPTAQSRAVQDQFARDGLADAQTVAAALRADGIAPARISIGYVGDAGKPAREVRLYVR
ncbi:MAG TPA: hypothetical protein VFN46_01940, partial [Acetobacteraceae bacterium]|nr:hypothetical protein [Acetobacteraceae bacterium]